jgi:hypothetical protein
MPLTPQTASSLLRVHGAPRGRPPLKLSVHFYAFKGTGALTPTSFGSSSPSHPTLSVAAASSNEKRAGSTAPEIASLEFSRPASVLPFPKVRTLCAQSMNWCARWWLRWVRLIRPWRGSDPPCSCLLRKHAFLPACEIRARFDGFLGGFGCDRT